ncbi:MAG: DUF2069 domain-containing protein [Steroidobacteraceae bacterium]
MTGQNGFASNRIAIAAWLALLLSVLCWPLGPSAVGWPITAIAFMPLLLPLPGLVRGTRRTQSWAPLALAPALAMALTEVLVNPAVRLRVTLTLALILAAFAAILAALRRAPRG